MPTFESRDTSSPMVTGASNLNLQNAPNDTDPSIKPVIEVMSGQKTGIDIQLFDSSGSAITIPESGVTVKFHAATSPKRYSFTKTVDITGHAEGKVSFTLKSSNTARPGIYDSILYAQDSNGDILANTGYWLIINKDPFSNTKLGGPVSLAEVRLFLRDNNRGRNLLLGDFEFGDHEIIAAMMMPINEFNETNPPRTNYTPSTFPYRYHWIKATAGYLLESAANRYERNRLSYRADDVMIDDQAKAETYLGISSRYLDEWKNFVREEKYRLNVSNFWGSTRGWRGR